MYCIALLKPSGGFQQLNTFASQKTPQINSPLAKAICILHFNKVSSNYKSNMKCSEINQSLKQTHQIYFVNTDETCI